MNIFNVKKWAKDGGRNRGYTLLFAVLTAVLVLGVAVFITSVSRKQFILSETARESTFSFYAADSGMECAAAEFANNQVSSTSPSTTLYCGGKTATIGAWSTASPGDPTQTRVSPQAAFMFDNDGCALITFTTYYDSNGNPATVIDSLGYNECTAAGGTPAPTASSRTVERALELTYD
jgi:Tfp pilus assembly protein PilX